MDIFLQSLFGSEKKYKNDLSISVIKLDLLNLKNKTMEDVKKPSDCMPQMLGFETVSAHG